MSPMKTSEAASLLHEKVKIDFAVLVILLLQQFIGNAQEQLLLIWDMFYFELTWSGLSLRESVDAIPDFKSFMTEAVII